MKTQQQRGQKTRQKIIQTAFDLFHKQGIHATSVDEILKESGAGKSQFYHYFQSKEDLIGSVVKGFCKQISNQELPLKWNIRTWNDLKIWLESFVQFQKNTGCERGCPMGIIGYELGKDHKEIRKDLNRALELTKQPLVTFFMSLKTHGKFKTSLDPYALADFCMLVIQGGLIFSKIRKETSAFERSIDHLLCYLKSLQQ